MSALKLLLFALTPVLVLLAVAELTVRTFGLAESCPDSATVHSDLWTCDPVLGFRTRPGLLVNGQGMNALGFRGPDYDATAPLQIIALGDSTTFGYVTSTGPGVSYYVAAPYPERLAAMASAKLGPGNVSVLNAGVCGYNTYHGIMLLRTHLRRLRPTLMIVKYGWNDLLTSADGVAGAYHEPATELGRDVEDLLLKTALYPFARRLALELPSLHGAAHAGWTQATWTPNVPLEDYAAHIRRIVALARARDIPVWLATSGDAFLTDEYRNREDPYAVTAAEQLNLNRLGGIQSFHELAAIHAAYNAAVRTVGAELDVRVVDLAAVYQAHAAEHLFSDVDAVHPLEAGHALEASALFAELHAQGEALDGRMMPIAMPPGI